MIATTIIRCPQCGKKLGDYLEGFYKTICPRCHAQVAIDSRKQA